MRIKLEYTILQRQCGARRATRHFDDHKREQSQSSIK